MVLTKLLELVLQNGKAFLIGRIETTMLKTERPCVEESCEVKAERPPEASF